LSLLEAASLKQVEAALLDVASLSQLEAASLSLEEALSLCLLDREGAPSLFMSVSFVQKQRRESSMSPSLLERKRVLWKERERESERSSTTEGGSATRLLEPRRGSVPLSLR
jgi:hypothetical protein